MRTRYFFIKLILFSIALTYCISHLQAQTIVNGHLTVNTTWTTANSPYVIDGDLRVDIGVTLTVMPGVIVKFQDHYEDLFIDGRIIANGTASQPIYFTSYLDDTRGGDTNGDGTATSPDRDQWGAIWLYNTSTNNQFEHCWIGYGGGWGTNGMINVYSTSTSFKNCTIAFSQERGVNCFDAAPLFENNLISENLTDGINYQGFDNESNVVLTNNTFINNVNWAVIANASSDLLNLSLDGNTSTGSAHNGFGINGSLSGASQFSTNSNFPIIPYADLSVDENASLTIAPGSILKFNDHYTDFFVNGQLIANGTSTLPITFTSLLDDAHGGDTNGDGNATEPAGDQWGAIWLYNTGSNNSFEHCWMGYGGGWATNGMINVYSTGTSFDNCTISNSWERGLNAFEVAPSITNCLFKNNGTNGIHYESLNNETNMVLNNNIFEDNVEWAAVVYCTDDPISFNLLDNTSTGAKYNGFGIHGTLSSSSNIGTNNDFPIIVYPDLTVLENAVLSIIPGSVIKFYDHYTDLFINGKIVANGTIDNPIVFTSLLDDAHGGDTNGDGNATEPAGNQWAAIWLYDTGSNNSFEHCWFGYGAGWGTNGMINVYSTGTAFKNCTIAYSQERGMNCFNAAPLFENNTFTGNLTDGVNFQGFDNETNVILSNNTFEDNVNWAVIANALSDLVILDLDGNTSSGSAHNGFGINGTLSGSSQFSTNGDFPIIPYEDLTIEENASLTIAPGSILKCNNHYTDLFVNGQIIANGTAVLPIVLTSLYDDAHGGDTNGDGNATEPAGDQWGAIWLYDTGTNNSFEHCWIGYGGGWATSGMINVYASATSVNNSTIAYSRERGINTFDVAPSFNNNLFIGNQTDGLNMNGFNDESNIVLNDNTFEDNTNWSVIANASSDLIVLDLDGNSSTGSAHNGFGINGSLAGSSQFSTNGDFPVIPYEDLTVEENATLTITPGSILKFNNHYTDLFVNGQIIANGTAVLPIVFTSLADDVHGGDTNGDLDATQPAGNQWASIWLYDTGSNNSFDHCWIGYGAGWSTPALIVNYAESTRITNSTLAYSIERGLHSENTSPFLANNSFISNATDGIYFQGLSQTRSLSIENNEFIDNENWAIACNNLGTQADIDLISNKSTGSRHNGFGITGSIDSICHFRGNTDTDFPFIIYSDFSIPETASLTFKEGSVIKFDTHYDDLLVYGELNAIGTSAEPIVFTSLYDECYGGLSSKYDTIDATPNQWAAIHFIAPAASGTIKNAIIAYGGGYLTSGQININTSNVSIDSCIIHHSDDWGVGIADCSPTISNSMFSDNRTGIYCGTAATPTIENNYFVNNSNYGLYNADGSVTIDAISNYWGSISGPQNAILNPDGSGNQVTDFVDFIPFLTTSGIDLTGAEPSFIHLISGTTVSFINITEGDGEYIWDLGDGTTNVLNNPIHTYSSPGNYVVCLNTTNRTCLPSESICKTISIKGISTYAPIEAGNGGDVTLTVNAGGLDSLTQFKLSNGSTEISPSDIYIHADGVAELIFDFSTTSTGIWDLTVVYEDGTQFTAETSFTIVDGFEAEPGLEIIARDAALLNVWTKYEVVISNPGNVDMYGVPVFITHSEIQDLELEFTNVEFVPSQYSMDLGNGLDFFKDVDVSIEVDSLFGEPNHSRVYALYVNKVPAGQEVSLKMKIKSPANFEFQAWVNDPYYTNYVDPNHPIFQQRGGSFNGRYLACISSIIAEKLYDFIPGGPCVNTILKTVFKPLGGFQANGGNASSKVFVTPTFWNWVQIGLDCGKSLFGAYQLAHGVIKLIVDFKEDVKAILDCKKVFDPKKKKKKDINIVQSFDPNEKQGPTGVGNENYLAEQDYFSYTIFFENHPDSAQVPAHTITILDTLDTSIFDIESLEFNEFTIGDSSLTSLPNVNKFTGNISLSNLGAEARVLAEVDSITGILECKFLSLDPLTGDEIEDPFIGILPPNHNSPEGEGSVSFRIRLKNPAVNNQIIANKAWIYFDGNKPIETNPFINQFDLEPPQTEIQDLDPNTTEDSIRLVLTGSDAASGIEAYEVWVENQDSLYLWRTTKSQEIYFTGILNEQYKFFSIGIDKVGNKEDSPAEPDTETTFVVSTNEINALYNSISISPNPANERIIVTYQTSSALDMYFEISNTLGQNVYSTKSSSELPGQHEVEIDLTPFENGLYYFNIRMNEQLVTKKFLITK